MKIKYFLIFTLMFIGFQVVSAEDCFGMDASCPDGFKVNCYQTSTYVAWECISDGSESGPEVSLDGQEWCDKGYVIDYKTNLCCPGASPFQQGNGCYPNPISAPDADNYYTRKFTCTPGDVKCIGEQQYKCSGILTVDWVSTGTKIRGVCGYLVCDNGAEKCSGYSLIRCEAAGPYGNIWWRDKGVVAGKCGAECAVDADCPADKDVNSICVSGKQNVNFVDNYCDKDTYQCEKKASVRVEEYIAGKCGVECTSNSDCPADKKISEFCNAGTLNENYEFYTCENFKCIPDQKTIESREIGVCDLNCNNNSECAEERVTGKYWKDRKLYYDIINQECQENICTDIIEPIYLEEEFETAGEDIDGSWFINGFLLKIINFFKNIFT